MGLKKKIAGLIITALALTSTGTNTVFAASTYATSGTVTKSVYGYTYNFYSTLWVNPSYGAFAQTYCGSGYDTAPAGYIGVQPILYKGSILCKSEDWNYNNEPCGARVISTDYNKETGTYYSYGKVQLYNGNGYDEYTSYQSPRLSFTLSSTIRSIDKTNNVIDKLNNLSIPATKINKYGETFGSGLAVYTTGEEPDLITAYGIDGTSGYVRATELESQKARTPEEAIAITKENHNGRTINLYDSTGKNVIGSFKISPSQKNTATK